MLGLFTFSLESEEFEKSEKMGADLYQPMITTRAPDGANKALIMKKRYASWVPSM